MRYPGTKMTAYPDKFANSLCTHDVFLEKESSVVSCNLEDIKYNTAPVPKKNRLESENQYYKLLFNTSCNE